MEAQRVVTAFLQHAGKILLLRRSAAVRTFPGRWAAVSGSIDGGRTPEEQARVEISEEIGLGDDDIALRVVGVPLLAEDPPSGRTFLVHPFAFAVGDPEKLRLNWENTEARWIAPEELARFETVPRLGDTWEKVATAPPVADLSPEALVEDIAERLSARGELLGVVETAAGGRIVDLLTDRAGASRWLAGGAIAYSNESKRLLANLTPEDTARVGAVSESMARWLAGAARRTFGAAWGIGETGIAGPQAGRRSRKPAGLAYLAVQGPTGRERIAEVQTGHDRRTENKSAFALTALGLLSEELDLATRQGGGSGVSPDFQNPGGVARGIAESAP